MYITNIPAKPFITCSNKGEKFFLGNEVRILLNNHNQYIGKIFDIRHNEIDVDIIKIHERKSIFLSDICKMRIRENNEDLNNAPYFDDEEKEFWRTHWITKDGIKEKTPEEIKELEKFFKSQDN